MTALLAFLLWFLGAYAAGICFGMLTTWGPSRIACAVVLWPVVVAGLLLYGLATHAGKSWRSFKEGWR